MRFHISADKKILFESILREVLDSCRVGDYVLENRELMLSESTSPEILSCLEDKLNHYRIQITDPAEVKVVDRIADLIADLVESGEIQDRNLSEILEKATGLSYSYLARLFVRSMLCSPEEYYIRRKIEKAKWMVIHNEFTFKEIAYQLGYSSLGHLSKQFKKQTGLTLTFFREVVKNKRKYYGGAT